MVGLGAAVAAVIAVAERIGVHRKGGPVTRWVPRRDFEPERRAEAQRITRELGGWAWVVWSLRDRAYLAFGRWGSPPVTGGDRAGIEREIRAAYVRMRQGGR